MKYLFIVGMCLVCSSCGVFKGNPDGLVEQVLEEAIEETFDVEIDLSPEE